MYDCQENSIEIRLCNKRTCEELKVFIEIVGKNISRLWSNVVVSLVINEMHPN